MEDNESYSLDLSRKDRIETKKNKIGNRRERKLKKYSENFEEMFTFFLQSYRKDILTFCGSKVEVSWIDDNGKTDGKYSFRKFENGQFKWKKYNSYHPNILKGVITGKKSWGLFLNMWAEGIAECNFTKNEIIQEFTDKGITIPECLLKDFENRINKLKYG